MSNQALAVSAPGKVLFTGGFLVLDRKHTGLVLGLDARIHVHVQPWKPAKMSGSSFVLVRSPQFQDANWLYTIYSDAVDTPQLVQQITTSSTYTTTSNKFVETTLCYTLSYLKVKGVQDFGDCIMTILADESYYSQNTTSSSTAAAEGFINFGCKLNEAHKTGLGSSAALVTSLTTSLISYYDKSSDLDVPKQTIHNLAQAAHCAAQGKVGSGFDVAAAVYGACLYRRFTPAILEAVGDSGVTGFADRLRKCINENWDVETLHEAVQIPKSLSLLMCDVDCGSETPGMVRQILAWRQEKPAEADLLWTAIQEGSNELCKTLTRLAQTGGDGKDKLQEVSDILSTIRDLVREMSRKSGVPVEPAIITELLDYCSAIPGVVGGVAPGAGGYDAVALLVENDPAVVAELEAKLSQWKAREEGTGVTIGKVQLLKARQAYEGVRREDVSRYSSWTANTEKLSIK